MNVKKKVWYQIDTVGGSRRQKILAVLVLKEWNLFSPIVLSEAMEVMLLLDFL